MPEAGPGYKNFDHRAPPASAEWPLAEGFLTFHAADEDSPALMASIPTEFKGVTAVTKANVYFDGKVVSHSLLFADGSKKTLGLIYPGKFHFGTDKAEVMEIVAGACRVKLDGQTAVNTYAAGQVFDVPAKSGFDIEVASGICEYICSFVG
jgi:uncharacterized protein YaiE (UPF0345 family)